MPNTDTNTPATPMAMVWVCIVIALATTAAYYGVLSNEYLAFDDATYVTDNVHIQRGLTLQSLLWTFNVGYAANWHPLTWMSHMLDYQLHEATPLGCHLANLLLHLANTSLLLWTLGRMTGAWWKSAFVAALFALHPLHVESVAWAAERKDLLSALFWFLTMLAYLRYARRPGLRSYLLVIVAFLLGLMAKPMLVTLPVILLLLDFWPLGGATDVSTRTPKRRLADKLPLAALALAASAVTVAAQHSRGAVGDLTNYPLAVRLDNALVTYVEYGLKMLRPLRLAAFYPHPGTTLPVLEIVASAIALAIVTGLVIHTRRSHPYLFVGWLWYVLSLLPVIGMVQVGNQAMADRYTYIPLVGLFIMLAWGIPTAVDAMSDGAGAHKAKLDSCFV